MIDKNSLTWRVLKKECLERKEDLLVSLVLMTGNIRQEDIIRGRIRQLEEILELPDIQGE